MRVLLLSACLLLCTATLEGQAAAPTIPNSPGGRLPGGFPRELRWPS